MLYDASGGIASTADLEPLAKLIVEGDGLGWPGDPRMELRIGILTHKPTGRTGKRLEVHRNNEDGSVTLVSHWLPSEQHRILFDLSRMRLDSPGHVDTLDIIDKHNEKKEAEASDQFRDSYGEMLDHFYRLNHDLTQPKNRFYLNDIKPKTEYL